MGAKTPVKEQWAAAQLWKQHQWTTGEAVRQLGKPKPTLISWKKKYWDMAEPPPDVGDRCRVKGGGRKYRMASYELDVLTFYDDCLRENGKVSFAEMLAHCTKIPEFSILKGSTQRARVRRFMNRYDPNQAQAEVVRAAVKTSQVAGNTVDSSSLTAECYSAQQQSQPKSDGEPDVAQDVAMDDDGEQVEPEDGVLPTPGDESETAECYSAQQQSQPRSDGEPDVAQDVAMDDDGEQVEPEDGVLPTPGDESETAECYSAQQQSQPRSDGEPDVAQDVAMDDDGEQVEPEVVVLSTPGDESETAECYSAQQQSQPRSDGEPDVAQDVAMDDDGEQVEPEVVVLSTPGDAKRRACGSNENGYSLRCRQNPQVPAAVNPQETGAAQPVTVSIPLFPDDFLSVKDGNMVTNTIVDWCISRYAPRTPGVVITLGSAVFVEINSAYSACQTEHITGEMDWDGYRYILLPVVLHDHWSLLVIVRGDAGNRVFYHVNSVQGVHNPEYLFSVLQWFFSAVNSRTQASMETQAFSYVSKPRQANAVDCGVYMLHYLYKIKSYVAKHEPRSLSEIMTMLTMGSFNAASASKARASLLKNLSTTA